MNVLVLNNELHKFIWVWFVQFEVSFDQLG